MKQGLHEVEGATRGEFIAEIISRIGSDPELIAVFEKSFEVSLRDLDSLETSRLSVIADTLDDWFEEVCEELP